MVTTTAAIRPQSGDVIVNTPVKPFSCEWPGCTEAYTRRTILQNHIKAEHRHIRHICLDCSKEFRYANDLRQHQKRIHEKQRLHVCRAERRNLSGCVCERALATSSELYRHHRAVIRKDLLGHESVLVRPPGLNAAANASHRPETVKTMQTAPLYIAPSQIGPLDSVKHAMMAIRDYVTDSWECGRWFTHPSGYASSAKSERLQYPRLLLPFDSVKAALAVREYHVASMQMNILCQAAQAAIEIEDPVCYLDSFLIHFEVIAIEGHHRPQLIYSYELLMRHLYAMSKKVRGPDHPWTITMRFLLAGGYQPQFKEILLTITRLMLDCYMRFYGPHTLGTLRLKLLFAMYMDDEGEQLRHTMQSSVEALPVEKQIMRAEPPESSRIEKPAAVKTELDPHTQNLVKDENNGTCRSSGKMLIMKWQYRTAVAAGRWDEAADIIGDGIMPVYDFFCGAEDASQDQWLWLLRLEEALQNSGQMHRARQAREKRLCLTRRMEFMSSTMAIVHPH